MHKYLRARMVFPFASLVFAIAFVWQVAIALAQPPQPNPLAPVPGVDITVPGPAATIHGDPTAGRILFAQNCVSCHGVRGVGGIPNDGSDDGTVPGLNPIDPEFLEHFQGDPAIFARDIDLFIQHGSRPSGPDPELSMVGWGDHNLLTQKQIADIEAYIMELNGVYWPDRWAPPVEVQMQATRDGNVITYQIILVNHSGADITDLDLTDTLPPGLRFVTSYFPSPGENPSAWSGSTVEWINDEDSVPRGGTLGPFVIVTQLRSNTVAVTPNLAQLFFTWVDWAGNNFSSSAVSQPIMPP